MSQKNRITNPLDALKHRENFRENGFTRIPGFFSETEMDSLIADIKQTTPTISKGSGLNSGAMLFYENLFLKDEKFRKFISQQRLIDFLKEIVGPDFWVRWDQVVYKGKGAPEFPWHQDNAYNHLHNEHFQLWIALSEINAERGGLWLVPGSHKNGRLRHSRIGNHLVFSGSTENAICIEAKKGDLVLFSSFMLHYTTPNVTTHDRWAYVVEYMPLEEQDPYIEKPFFVAARNGASQPEFVPFTYGRMKYYTALVKARLEKYTDQVEQRMNRVRRIATRTNS